MIEQLISRGVVINEYQLSPRLILIATSSVLVAHGPNEHPCKGVGDLMPVQSEPFQIWESGKDGIPMGFTLCAHRDLLRPSVAP